MSFPEMQQSTADFLKIAETVYVDEEYGSPWQDQFLAQCRKSKRTLARWIAGAPLPGPVRAMILAHQKCRRYGVEF